MFTFKKGLGIWPRRLMLSACLLQFAFTPASYANFINGGFDDNYIPSNANTFNPINGWTLTGYRFNGNLTTAIPTSLVDINLTPGTTPGGITDIIAGTTQTLDDWFLFGATPPSTLKLPATGLQSVMVNLRSVNLQQTVSGTSGKPTGWTTIGRQATSISQQMTVLDSDVDPIDGKVHIRFKVAPVLENPSHAINEQPFFATQLNNITTGRIAANPLFFGWNFADQQGVPWNTLSTAGTNSGSNTTYLYTNFQGFDISPGNAFIHVGDIVELVILASGCSLGGHDGHVYVDDVSTGIPPGLWVSATGPSSSTPGANVTYTYTYTNAGSTPVDNVQVVANLPLQGTPVNNPAPSTTFVSSTTPTTGISPFCTGTSPVTCSMGTLQPGQTGTFQLTVNIPSTWALSTGPVNNGNYPISGSGVSSLLGPLVQTNLVSPSNLSNLVVNVNELPTQAYLGSAYSGTFTCSNILTANASGDAPDASCDITNLPAGLIKTGCTISPTNLAWSEPSTIPINQTVICTVSGTPTTIGAFTAIVTTNAVNNLNSTTNHADVVITVNGLVNIPATLNGSPILSPAVVACGRPVLLGSLPIPGFGLTNYVVSARTGGVNCIIGQSGSQTYFKMNGAGGSCTPGSCTIIGTKNGITSSPLTLVTPCTP